MFLNIVLLVVFLLDSLSVQASYSCDPNTCRPPTCFCASTSPPGGLSPSNTPQFILLTFDDAVAPYYQSFVDQILSNHVNPNKCPITATYFVSTVYTDFWSLQQLYVKGHEIATHTVNHIGDPPEAEIVNAKTAITGWAPSIPADHIRGFRAPFLLYSQNTFNLLKKNNFLYDCSISEPPHTGSSKDKYWPYTLDYGIAQTCDTGTCDNSASLPGLWEIPMYTLDDASGNVFASMDPVGTDILTLLKNNFNAKYNGNRSPMGIFLHAAWLMQDPNNIVALNNFLSWALTQPNVWLTTGTQLIDYMKNPIPASQMMSSAAFGAGDCSLGRLVKSSAEICDGADNNGNGQIDEGLINSCVYQQYTIHTCLQKCPVSVPTVDTPVPALGTISNIASSACQAPTGGCVYGTWNTTTCTCNCLNQLTNTNGFCLDGQGICTISKTYTSPNWVCLPSNGANYNEATIIGAKLNLTNSNSSPGSADSQQGQSGVLGGGAIAGIVIGVLAAAVIVVVGSMFLNKKLKEKKMKAKDSNDQLNQEL